MFKKHFNLVVITALVKQLYETKNKNKNDKLVNLIKSGLSNLKDEITEISKDEIENEKPDKIVEIAEEILDFNKKIRKQQGLGLKILTPNQMLSRLPIILAQLKAGNNSKKLKNKIRQLFILCADQGNLQSNSIKVWLTIFKNGSNLYEHWK